MSDDDLSWLAAAGFGTAGPTEWRRRDVTISKNGERWHAELDGLTAALEEADLDLEGLFGAGATPYAALSALRFKLSRMSALRALLAPRGWLELL